MTPDTMPSWLIDYLEENTMFSRPGKFGYPYYTTTKESDAVVDFYNFITKPENLMKFPEVAKLIEALQMYLDGTLFIDEDGESYDSDFEDAIDKAKEALASFKGGE